MLTMTRDQEQFAIERFKKMYTELPDGEIIRKDPPWTDFLLITKNGRTIGIEVTGAIHSEKAKEQSSTNFAFTDLVLHKLTTLLPFYFSLSVKLIENAGISKSKKDKIAQGVAELCVKEFSNLKNNEHKQIQNITCDLNNLPSFIKNQMKGRGYRNLPEGIKSIRIARIDEHGSSFNLRSEAAVIPEFTLDRLTQRLRDKEAKIENYIPCDEFWLIIWQGGGITGYFTNTDLGTPIKSKFNKVFIVREFEDPIVLKS